MAGIKTKTIPAEKWARHADEVAAIVRGGGVILFPTETVYGIGSSADVRGVEKLAGMKCRAPGKPFQVLISDRGRLLEWGALLCPEADKLIEAFWPGPLTLALEVDSAKAPAGIAPRQSVGFRIPAHDLCLDLLRRAGGAMAATSANISGDTEARTCVEAIRCFGDALDAAIDAGPISGSPPSTVVAVRNGVVTVLREGAIPAAKILEIAGVSENQDN